MNQITSTIISKLLEATANAQLEWLNQEGWECFTSTFKEQNYILCKYDLENGRKEIMLNEANEDGFIEGDFNEFQEGHEFFPNLDQLHAEVEKRAKIVAPS